MIDPKMFCEAIICLIMCIWLAWLLYKNRE